MEPRMAVKDSINPHTHSEHERDWRRSLIPELLLEHPLADDFEAALTSHGIEFERYPEVLWVCYDRGGETSAGDRKRSEWGGFAITPAGSLAVLTA